MNRYLAAKVLTIRVLFDTSDKYNSNNISAFAVASFFTCHGHNVSVAKRGAPATYPPHRSHDSATTPDRQPTNDALQKYPHARLFYPDTKTSHVTRSRSQ